MRNFEARLFLWVGDVGW